MLRHLQILRMNGSAIFSKLTNQALNRVSMLSGSLIHLEISGHPGNDNIAALATLQQLSTLLLSGTSVDDTCVSNCLSRLPNLVELDLSNTKITQRVVEEIARNVSRLSSLNLSNIQLDMSAMEHLATMGSLKSLSLAKCGLSSENAQPLLRLHNLQILDISDNSIDRFVESDVCTAPLPNLENLNLARTAIRDDTIERLQRTYIILNCSPDASAECIL